VRTRPKKTKRTTSARCRRPTSA